MNTDKVYILQRDLPDCEAGRLIQYDSKAAEYFAFTHGGSKIYFQERTIEDNPEWFILKTENKSNDSFQWTDSLVGAYANFVQDNVRPGEAVFHSTMIERFKESKKPKPQAENKPEWEIVAYSCGYMGLNDIIFKKQPDGQFRTFDYRLTPEQKQYSYPEDAITNSKIHSVKRLSDNQTFSVGDEVVHKTDGMINTAKILKFVIPQVIENKIWFEFMEGYDYCKDLANFNRLPPQPQKEEQRIEVTGVGYFNYQQDSFPDNGFGLHNHIFSTRPSFPKEKYPLIKQAIEQVLNDEKVYEMFGTEFMMIPKADYQKYIKSLNSKQ